MTLADYPAAPAERTRWIVARRGRKNLLAADRPYAFFAEREPNADGSVAQVATIFLTNRECPWRCVMCDLWRNTTDQPVPPGAIARQIERALSELPACTRIKLYNSGSFFDQGAIARSEWEDIARLCASAHVTVESHPRLIGPAVLDFAEMLSGRLEVALGLETADARALDMLNKRFDVADYQRAAAFLHSHAIGLRTFLLVHPPFVERSARLETLNASLHVAFDAGSDVVSLIPLRHGNGAVDLLAEEPALGELEHAHETALRLQRGRAFADTWDLERFSNCSDCALARKTRLTRMNLTQSVEPRVICPTCGNRGEK